MTMTRIFLLLLCLVAAPALAQNKLYSDGNGIRIYHTLFNSQMMEASAANALGLVRAPNMATLTVALTKPEGVDQFSLGKPGLLRAHILNILGQRTELEFTPVNEGEVTYYIAQIRYTDRETLRVFILAGFDDGSRGEATFHQQMYIDDE